MWSLVPGRYNGNSITYFPVPAFLSKRHKQGRTAQFKQRYGTTQTCFAAPKNDWLRTPRLKKLSLMQMGTCSTNCVQFVGHSLHQTHLKGTHSFCWLYTGLPFYRLPLKGFRESKAAPIILGKNRTVKICSCISIWFIPGPTIDGHGSRSTRLLERFFLNHVSTDVRNGNVDCHSINFWWSEFTATGTNSTVGTFNPVVPDS